MMMGRARFAVAAGAIALSLTAPSVARAEPQRVIAGTVADFHGKYGLVVRDLHGALAEVTLHQGTVIKPLGLRLERGMKVIVLGQAADRTFAAAEVNAPLEQWPTARAAAFAQVQRNAESVDTKSLNSSRDPNSSRWSQVPDQFSLPYTKEPPR